jgi:hypothetical protein
LDCSPIVSTGLTAGVAAELAAEVPAGVTAGVATELAAGVAAELAAEVPAGLTAGSRRAPFVRGARVRPSMTMGLPWFARAPKKSRQPASTVVGSSRKRE